MRVLLDESLPRQLAREIVGHDVRPVPQEGWAGLQNGALLRSAAQAKFDVFVTADQNLQYQQNLKGSGVGIIVLAADTNRLPDLLPLVPELLATLMRLRVGEIIRVGG